jgi:hypothetical protein
MVIAFFFLFGILMLIKGFADRHLGTAVFGGILLATGIYYRVNGRKQSGVTKRQAGNNSSLHFLMALFYLEELSRCEAGAQGWPKLVLYICASTR